MKTVTGIRFFLLSVLLVLCGACAESSGSVKREGTIKVVATTAIVGDLVRNIAGERAEVVSLMGTGGRPASLQGERRGRGEACRSRHDFL